MITITEGQFKYSHLNWKSTRGKRDVTYSICLYLSCFFQVATIRYSLELGKEQGKMKNKQSVLIDIIVKSPIVPNTKSSHSSNIPTTQQPLLHK